MTYSLNTLNSDAAHHATRGLARYAQELGLLFGLIGLVFWGLALASYNPVSYTHLTLPTKA